MPEEAMSQTFMEAATSLSQVVANIAVCFGVLAVYFLYKQIRLAEKAIVGQNTISLMEYIMKSDIRLSRRYIMKDQTDEHFEDHAADVIASYDVVGILIKNGYVDKYIFVDNFGPSIIQCFEKTDEFRTTARRKQGERY